MQSNNIFLKNHVKELSLQGIATSRIDPGTHNGFDGSHDAVTSVVVDKESNRSNSSTL
jgi:hypothetical protein